MKKYIISFLMVLMVCCLLIGCGSSDETDTEQTGGTDGLVIPEHQTLRIMCNDTSKDYVETLTKNFTVRNTDVSFDITYIEGVQSLEYSQKLSADLLAGNGPDIILLNPLMLSVDDVSLLQSDVLADINKLNDIYHYLEWDDYAENIISAGVFDGERKILPAFYTVPILVGMEESLKAEGILYGEGVFFASFSESLAASSVMSFYNPITAVVMYYYTGLEVIDEYGNSANLSDPRFKAFVETYDKLFPDLYNGRYRDYVGSNSAYANKLCGGLLAGDYLFLNGQNNRPAFCSLVHLDEILRDISQSGNTPVLTHIATIDGKGVAGSLGWSFGINSATKAPEAALRFLEYSVSFEYNCDDKVVRGISVNNQYFNAVKALYYDEVLIMPKGIPMHEFLFEIETLDRSVLDAYYGILAKVYIPNYTSANALGRAELAVIEMSKNGLDIDTAISIAKNSLDIYLSE